MREHATLNEMMKMFALFYTNTLKWIFLIVQLLTQYTEVWIGQLRQNRHHRIDKPDKIPPKSKLKEI
jgi:hypothetical protein